MNFIKTLMAVLLANAIISGFVIAMVLIIGFAFSRGDSTTIDDGSYLVMDFYGSIPAYDPPESLMGELFGGDSESVHRILGNLEKAAVDERIKGVLIKISSHNGLGGASIQEIRRAIMKVRESGKPVYAYSDGLDRSAIFLASACDKIYVANDATVYFVGMGMVREYYKGFFDKIGVKANIHKIKDYKTAAEPYIREDMSPEAREMSKWLLDEFWDIQLTAISEGRGIEQERLVEMMDHILFTAPEAVDAGLVDEVMYWSDLVESLREGDDKSLKTVSQSEYADVSRSSLGLKGDKRIAIIHAHGTIGGRRSRLDPYLGPMIGHETVVRQLRAAADNDKIDAIVFRVDSGGGESLASGIIAHEVERVRSKKPIIASMIDVAASGGYALSYKATKIVADELTITGSIGSIYGKFTTAPMFNKIGVTFDSETKGPNALFWSTTTDFSEEQWARFTDFHFRSFNMWLSQVAEERGMEFEEAEKLAHGRVWTGRQAKENGLIDELGGLDRAIELAKEEIGLSVDEQVTLVHYPKKKGLYQLLSEGVSPMAAARWFAYKVIHEELAETARFLTNADVHVWDARVE